MSRSLRLFFPKHGSHLLKKRNPHAKKFQVCVLDSSFNPPTLAHQAMLQNCASKYPSDCYLLLLSTANADKGNIAEGNEDGKHGSGLRYPGGPEEGGTVGRLQMMQTVAESMQDLSNVAVGWATAPLFVDKVKAISAFFETPVDCMFVVGADTLIRIFDRKYYPSVQDMGQQLRAFFADATFAYANRVGSPGLEDLLHASGLLSEDVKGLLAEFKHRLLPIEISERLQGLSSTQARKLLHEGAPASELERVISPRVMAFIAQHRLYVQLESRI